MATMAQALPPSLLSLSYSDINKRERDQKKRQTTQLQKSKTVKLRLQQVLYNSYSSDS